MHALDQLEAGPNLLGITDPEYAARLRRITGTLRASGAVAQLDPRDEDAWAAIVLYTITTHTDPAGTLRDRAGQVRTGTGAGRGPVQDPERFADVLEATADTIDGPRRCTRRYMEMLRPDDPPAAWVWRTCTRAAGHAGACFHEDGAA